MILIAILSGAGLLFLILMVVLCRRRHRQQDKGKSDPHVLSDESFDTKPTEPNSRSITPESENSTKYHPLELKANGGVDITNTSAAVIGAPVMGRRIAPPLEVRVDEFVANKAEFNALGKRTQSVGLASPSAGALAAASKYAVRAVSDDMYDATTDTDVTGSEATIAEPPIRRVKSSSILDTVPENSDSAPVTPEGTPTGNGKKAFSKAEWLSSDNDKPYVPTAEVTRTFSPKHRPPVRIHRAGSTLSVGSDPTLIDEVNEKPAATIVQIEDNTNGLTTTPQQTNSIASDNAGILYIDDGKPTSPDANIPPSPSTQPAESTLIPNDTTNKDLSSDVTGTSTQPTFDQLMSLMALAGVNPANMVSTTQAPPVSTTDTNPPIDTAVTVPAAVTTRPLSAARLTNSRANSLIGHTNNEAQFRTPPRTPRTLTPSASPSTSHNRTRTCPSSPCITQSVVVDVGSIPTTPQRPSRNVMSPPSTRGEVLNGGWASSPLHHTPISSPSRRAEPSTATGSPQSLGPTYSPYSAYSPLYSPSGSKAVEYAGAGVTNSSKPRSHRQLFMTAMPMNDTMQT